MQLTATFPFYSLLLNRGVQRKSYCGPRLYEHCFHSLTYPCKEQTWLPVMADVCL